MTYQSPTQDIVFALQTLADLDRLGDLPGLEDTSGHRDDGIVESVRDDHGNEAEEKGFHSVKLLMNHFHEIKTCNTGERKVEDVGGEEAHPGGERTEAVFKVENVFFKGETEADERRENQAVEMLSVQACPDREGEKTEEL